MYPPSSAGLHEAEDASCVSSLGISLLRSPFSIIFRLPPWRMRHRPAPSPFPPTSPFPFWPFFCDMQLISRFYPLLGHIWHRSILYTFFLRRDEQLPVAAWDTPPPPFALLRAARPDPRQTHSKCGARAIASQIFRAVIIVVGR